MIKIEEVVCAWIEESLVEGQAARDRRPSNKPHGVSSWMTFRVLREVAGVSKLVSKLRCGVRLPKSAE